METLEFAQRGGVVGLLILGLAGFLKGWVVTRETYSEIVKERDTLRVKLDEANARDMKRLKKAEADLAAALNRGK